MPTISTSTTIVVPAGQKLTIQGTGAIATATVNPGSLGQIYTVGNEQDVFGPYDKATNIYIQISSGSVTYQTIDSDAVNALTEGGQVLTPSGDVVGSVVDGDGLNSNTDDTATISIVRQIKASAGRVTSIVCTSGTSIALVLYDNAAAAASGRQIYNGTLSGGDVVNPSSAWFDQGCFAQFSGTASFVINTSESDQ